MPLSLTAPSPDLLPVGKGQVLVNPYVAGVLTQWRHLGNVEVFELTTEDDVLDKFSSMDKTSALYKRITRRRNVILRMTLSEYSPENLAMIAMGTKSEITQAATPVVGEVLTADALLGAYYQLAKLGPYTAGPALTVTATPLVLGTDYEITDPILGIIHILSTAVNVNDTDQIDVDYTPTAYTVGSGVVTVRGGTESVSEFAVKFISDPSSGPKTHVDVWRASSTPDGPIGLISEEWSTIQVQMAVQQDLVNHPTEPLYRVTVLPGDQ
jgi:hypothetical protein